MIPCVWYRTMISYVWYRIYDIGWHDIGRHDIGRYDIVQHDIERAVKYVHHQLMCTRQVMSEYYGRPGVARAECFLHDITATSRSVFGSTFKLLATLPPGGVSQRRQGFSHRWPWKIPPPALSYRQRSTAEITSTAYHSRRRRMDSRRVRIRKPSGSCIPLSRGTAAAAVLWHHTAWYVCTVSWNCQFASLGRIVSIREECFTDAYVLHVCMYCAICTRSIALI